MDQPEARTIYLVVDDVIDLHAQLFGLTVQQAADRLRSRPVLEGAVERPHHHAHYAGADLADQAAFLAHGIAEGQPFIDGNKRTALLAMLLFLSANGSAVSVTQAELADQILRLSKGLSPEDFGAWIRASLGPCVAP